RAVPTVPTAAAAPVPRAIRGRRLRRPRRARRAKRARRATAPLPNRTAARRSRSRQRAPARLTSVRALLQRVTNAEVRVGDRRVGSIGPGWAVLVGVGRDDTAASARALADKIVQLRAFADDHGKMNRSALEVAAEVLVV